MRFPEFKEEWKESRLGDVVYFSKERIFSSELNNDNYISTENMLQDFNGITVSKNIPLNVSVFAYAKGDTLLSNIRPYLKKVWKADRNGGCSSDVFVIKANTIICNKDFAYYLIANECFISYVMCGTKGVKMPRGDKEQMKLYKISYPTIKEQQKIANLFNLLDERIETQSKIIEDLKTLINGVRNKLCQKSLPNTTLGDIAEIYQPQTISSSELNEDGEYFVYGANGIIGKYNNYNHTTEQICIACRGTCGIVNYTQKYSWINGNAMVINVDKFLHKVNKKYLYYLLSSMDFSSLISGSTQPQIVRSPIVKMKIYLPSLEKQEEISSVLDTFYKKKEIEKSILQNLKQQKKYLLQQMFI